MRATSGPLGSPSSETVALTSSLESRLRQLTADCGSTLYVLTWRVWDTPSGFRIPALRASVPRTSGRDCTGWPSPVVNDAKSSAHSYDHGDHKSDRSQLGDEAIYGTKGRPLAREAMKVLPPAGWGTPTATLLGNTPETMAKAKASMRSGARTAITVLNVQALMVRDPSTDSGPTLSGSPAPTEKRDLLNPEHSRWLQAFPAGWGSCAPTETPSVLKSRSRSSAP
jgi:hypothetical protein